MLDREATAKLDVLKGKTVQDTYVYQSSKVVIEFTDGTTLILKGGFSDYDQFIRGEFSVDWEVQNA